MIVKSYLDEAAFCRTYAVILTYKLASNQSPAFLIHIFVNTYFVVRVKVPWRFLVVSIRTVGILWHALIGLGSIASATGPKLDIGIEILYVIVTYYPLTYCDTNFTGNTSVQYVLRVQGDYPQWCLHTFPLSVVLMNGAVQVGWQCLSMCPDLSKDWGLNLTVPQRMKKGSISQDASFWSHHLKTLKWSAHRCLGIWHQRCHWMLKKPLLCGRRFAISPGKMPTVFVMSWQCVGEVKSVTSWGGRNWTGLGMPGFQTQRCALILEFGWPKSGERYDTIWPLQLQMIFITGWSQSSGHDL